MQVSLLMQGFQYKKSACQQRAFNASRGLSTLAQGYRRTFNASYSASAALSTLIWTHVGLTLFSTGIFVTKHCQFSANSTNFGHQMAPPGSATCITYKFGHQVTPLTLSLNLATRWSHLHCHIAWDCPFGKISSYGVGIFISQSHQLGLNKVSQKFVIPHNSRKTPEESSNMIAWSI